MHILKLEQFISGNDVFHLHRATINYSRFGQGHRHSYAEVFWVETGEIWHRVNGIDEKLSPGDICWITQKDWHAFRAASKSAAIINLLFNNTLLRELEGKYFAAGLTAPWKVPMNHTVNHLTQKELKTFNYKASQLAFAPQTRLSLDCFLLELLQTLTVGTYPHLSCEEYPEWLGRAVRKFVEQELWDMPLTDFATMAGRTPEHVSRTIRKFTGQTASELLNSLRLEKVAADLSMTTNSIIDIAMGAGFNNIGHFYKLFHRRFGQPPKKFRTERQALMLKRKRDSD